MPPTITEQLTQISARLDLLHDNMNKRFDMQDMRFDTQDIDIAALHDQIQTGQLDTILNINEGRDAIAALKQNTYRRQYNSFVVDPMAKLLIPLHPKGREVVLGNGYWGPQGPGVTRQTIEDATNDQISDLLQCMGVQILGAWQGNQKLFAWVILGLVNPQ